MYYRRPPRKRPYHYLMPLIVIGGLVFLLFFAWRSLNGMLVRDSQSISSERVFLNIESGSVKAMTVGKNEWLSAPDKIYLYRGEKLRTLSDGRLSLTFFDESIMRLDHNTQITFTELKRKKETNTIVVELEEGALWAKANRIHNPNSSFRVITPLLTVDTRGGTFVMEGPGSIYMTDGFAQVTIKDGKEVVATFTLGVGQEVTIDEALIAAIKNEEESNYIVALSDTFKTSEWYLFNQMKEGAISAEEAEEVTEAPITEATTSTTTTTDTESSTVDADDKTPPFAPVIKEPGANDSRVTLTDIDQMITGTVSEDTYAVIVNDYRLSKYVPGSKTFSYYARTILGNLKVGENEYKIIAEDKAGNASEPARITLILSQSVADEKAAQSSTDTTDTLPVDSSTGGVHITAPNGGKSFTTSETSFEITGEVPTGTQKVVVNDYALKAFTGDSTTFVYRASSSLDNLTIGAVNTYTAKAYDASNTLLGSASISIDVESGEAADPVIALPTTSVEYRTTLNELVVGGTVGKWVQKVYLNNELLSEYIPGSQEWKKTVTLSPGENTYTVIGEKDDIKTASDSITIILE